MKQKPETIEQKALRFVRILAEMPPSPEDVRSKEVFLAQGLTYDDLVGRIVEQVDWLDKISNAARDLLAEGTVPRRLIN